MQRKLPIAMITPTLHHYRFGQSRLASSVPLPVLPTATDDGTEELDIVLDTAPARMTLAPVTDWLHHWPAPNGSVTLSLAPHEAGYRLRFPALCDFLIDADAGRILIQPVQALDPGTLEHLIVDQVLPRVLSHRGALVAHASVVRIGRHAIAFLGHSGWGKSTLASLLHAAGHRLLSDDCAVLVCASNTIHAIPTYPSLRLFEDSIGQTLGDVASANPVATYSPKHRVTLGAPEPQDSISPLQAIYLLNDPAHPADYCHITSLPPASACMALVEHSFRLDLASTAHTTALLTQAAAVLRHAPAFCLNYPRDYATNARLLDTLIAHVANLTHPTTEPA